MQVLYAAVSKAVISVLRAVRANVAAGTSLEP